MRDATIHDIHVLMSQIAALAVIRIRNAYLNRAACQLALSGAGDTKLMLFMRKLTIDSVVALSATEV